MRITFFRKALFFCLLTLFIGSCYYDNKDDLYDEVIVPGTGACEFTDVSYSSDLSSIIDLYCNGACHNATDRQGNVILETYNQVKQYVDNGSFLGSIKHESSFVSMPPGSKLNSCDIQKIEDWIINQGAPNN